jgi:hypothetical protein
MTKETEGVITVQIRMEAKHWESIESIGHGW